MKLFLAHYSWQSSGPETSVILADSIQEARMFVLREEEGVVFVEKDIGELNEWKNPTECLIEEIEMKPGVIYTGAYCC